MRLTLQSEDGEAFLAIQGPTFAACMALVYARILSGLPPGESISVPPMLETEAQVWAARELDGARLTLVK